jgi:hypothetical protein
LLDCNFNLSGGAKMIKRSDGFVSLFTAIMISLLLLVITMSLVTLQALQLRKAQDAEQTLRAYYTAEAGVEDAVSKVLAMTPPYADQPCVADGNYDIPGASGWTCQQITFSGTPKGKLEQDEAKSVDPGHITSPPYHSVIIEWNQAPGAGPFTVPAGNLPSKAAYAALAPPLEVAIASYPNGGFRADQVCSAPGVPAGCRVKLQNALIVPRGTGPSGQVNYAGLLGAGQWNGNCGAMPRTYTIGGNTYTGYNCYAIITNLNSTAEDYLFRLRTRYLPSSYRMTFMTGATGGGSVVEVPDGTATIDVTAKAGQTYRRVISKLPLGEGAQAGLNYVIYSDTDVCKNFTVIDNAAPPPSSGC